LSQTAGGVTTSFIYDDKNVVLDKRSDGANVEYLDGLKIDQKLRQSAASTGPLYFLTDHLGGVTALADASGNVVERRRYETFGASIGSALTRYDFTGRERDSLTGLLYYRARWYNPRHGRFLSEDPAGFEGGTNLYEYADDDPVNLSDPDGLWATRKVGPGLGGRTHQNSIQRVLGGILNAYEIGLLKQTQATFDANENGPTDAYKHAMTWIGMTGPQAVSLANDWVREHIKTARCFDKNGDRKSAMENLSIAIHALQDHTSPAHFNFAPWANGGHLSFLGYGSPEYVLHMNAENFDPGENSSLDRATQTIYFHFKGLPMPYNFFEGFFPDPAPWYGKWGAD
jgi:RHS repeat-associated protein